MHPDSSPTRRVLGDKDRNASLNIASPRTSLKSGMNAPNVSLPKPRSVLFSNKPDLPPPSSRTGRKRTIAEVEGVDVQDWSRNPPRLSQSTEFLSDSASESDRLDTSMASTTAAKSMVDTSMTSYSGSQDVSMVLEHQFELPQEGPSQRSLEKFHAVPMPQNRSQTALLRTPSNLMYGASQESVGMSRFIDFGASDSSQRSDELEMIETDTPVGKNKARSKPTEKPSNVETAKLTTEEEQRKTMLDEKAAQLRTRLQLAYFKVQTNQTTRPLSRLKVPESMRRSASPPVLPPMSLNPPASTLRPAQLTQPPRHLDAESRISAMRAQATAQPKPKVSSLNSLPMPTMPPTAFSARFMNPSTTHAHPFNLTERTETVQIPSSPPVSRLSVDVEDGKTPSIQESTSGSDVSRSKHPRQIHMPPNQLSSPPASRPGSVAPRISSDVEEVEDSQPGEEDEDRTPRQSDIKSRPVVSAVKDVGNINSGVKVEAADGLLQLMRGVSGGGRGSSGS